MQSALPGHIVDVAVGVVDQAAAEHRIAAGEKAAADRLVGVTSEGLVWKADANLGVSRCLRIGRSNPIGKFWAQTVRVKPIRPELMRDGEKICTQVAPPSLVG